jgi:hypothetical protein
MYEVLGEDFSIGCVGMFASVVYYLGYEESGICGFLT